MGTHSKLISSHIEALERWRDQYPTVKIPDRLKTKILATLQRYMEVETVSEIDTLQPTLPKDIQNDGHTRQDSPAQLGDESTSEIKQKRPRKRLFHTFPSEDLLRTVKHDPKQPQKRSPRIEIDSDQYHSERKLDGARDHFNRRDQGRFGSHPSHDDLGEEAEP
mgnify:CR=1 FL=1